MLSSGFRQLTLLVVGGGGDGEWGGGGSGYFQYETVTLGLGVNTTIIARVGAGRHPSTVTISWVTNDVTAEGGRDGYFSGGYGYAGDGYSGGGAYCNGCDGDSDGEME